MIYVRTSFYTWKKDRVVDFLKWNPVLHNQISTLVFQSERFCRCTLFTRTWWRNHFQNHICSLVQVHLAFAAYFAQWGCVWWIFADRMGVPTPSFVNAGDGLFTHPIGEFVTRHSEGPRFFGKSQRTSWWFFLDQRRSTNFEPIQRYPKYHHLSRLSSINQSSEVAPGNVPAANLRWISFPSWSTTSGTVLPGVPSRWIWCRSQLNSVHHGHFHAIFNCRDDISPIQKGSVNPAAAVGHWNEMVILVLSMASMVSDRLRCLILSLILRWNTWIFNLEIMKILKHKDLVIKDKPNSRAMKVYGNLTRPSDWLYCAWDTLLNDEP